MIRDPVMPPGDHFVTHELGYRNREIHLYQRLDVVHDLNIPA
jgi:hypothetical protein